MKLLKAIFILFSLILFSCDSTKQNEVFKPTEEQHRVTISTLEDAFYDLLSDGNEDKFAICTLNNGNVKFKYYDKYHSTDNLKFRPLKNTTKNFNLNEIKLQEYFLEASYILYTDGCVKMWYQNMNYLSLAQIECKKD